MNKAYLTAISRKSLPVPTRWLLKNHYLFGHVLDFGCGKCAEINNRELLDSPFFIRSVTNYDPTFAPKLSKRARFDVIICNYVLCVLPASEEHQVLKQIQSHLKPNGWAYITVRNDVPKKGHGISSKGTFQRWVVLDLPLIHSTSQYRTYLLAKSKKFDIETKTGNL